MNEGTSNDVSMNEERISRTNEAEELFDELYEFFHRLNDILGEIDRQSRVEFSYDEE